MNERSTTEPHARQHIRRRAADGAVIVEVTGDVDHDSAPALRTAVHDAVAEAGGGTCVVDLTAVTYLDSAGLSVLLAAARDAAEGRGPLRVVVDASRPVVRPIKTASMDKVLHLYDTVEDALEAST